jgi:hypothetical protein
VEVIPFGDGSEQVLGNARKPKAASRKVQEKGRFIARASWQNLAKDI